MHSCTFVGHKDTPKEIKPVLRSVLINLIKHKDVDTFYVGTHGSFDFIVLNLLSEIKEIYTHIKYYKVLAYLPQKAEDYDEYEFSIYPELEEVPLKYAIIERNKWMIRKSDYLICYVAHNFSNAHKFLEFALKENKNVINLYSL